MITSFSNCSLTRAIVTLMKVTSSTQYLFTHRLSHMLVILEFSSHTHTFLTLISTWQSNTNHSWFPLFQKEIDHALKLANAVDNNFCIEIPLLRSKVIHLRFFCCCSKSHLIMYYTLSPIQLITNYILINIVKSDLKR